MATVKCLFTSILQNILFCVQQKKEIRTGLRMCKWWQSFHVWVNDPFNTPQSSTLAPHTLLRLSHLACIWMFAVRGKVCASVAWMAWVYVQECVQYWPALLHVSLCGLWPDGAVCVLVSDWIWAHVAYPTFPRGPRGLPSSLEWAVTADAAREISPNPRNFWESSQ